MNFEEFTRKVQKFPLVEMHKAGVFIFSIEEFEEMYREQDFADTYFTKAEIEYCRGRMASLAGRYAGKMAVVEALGTNREFGHMNILPNASSQPIITIQGESTRIALSITHENDLAGAVAGIIGERVLALGIDATRIKRIEEVLKNQPNIVKAILTEREQEEIKSPLPPFRKGGITIHGDVLEVARKWTGKESVSKALGVGVWHGGSLKEIEILKNKADGVVLHGSMKRKAEAMGIVRWDADFVQDDQYTVGLVAGSG